MKSLFLCTLALGTFLITGCNSNKILPVEPKSTINVSHLDQLEVSKFNQLVYALPQTRLRFKITADKTIRKQGPLYRYSERFIGIKDIILKDEEVYLFKSIELETIAEPDPDQYYELEFSGRDFVPTLKLTADGCIAGFNVPEMGMEEDINILESKTSPIDTSFKYTPYLEDQLVVNSTAKMAEEAANFIYRIRDNRAALVSGELSYFPTDGSALSLSLEEMAKMEKEFLSLFLGKEAHEEVVFYVDYLPQEEVNKALIFRFSQFKGLVDKMDLSGNPYYVSAQIKTDNINTVDTAKVNNKGLFYRMPAKTTIKITNGSNTVFEDETSVAQFGSVLSLPEALCTKPDVSIQFFEKTGALKKISIRE